MTSETIASQFVAAAERIAERLRAPRVRALHLPPLAADGGQGAEFCALELDDGSVGLSYVSAAATRRALQGGLPGRAVEGRSAASIARGYAAADPVDRALGFAAVNALSQALFSRAGWLPDEAADSLGHLRPEAGEHIGMIGLFGPLVPRIVEAGARLTVLELDPALAVERPEYRVALDPRAIADCTKVVSTCAVLLNDTLEGVLAACRAARVLAVVGPTAGCLPDPLFARGVGIVGGRRIADPPGFAAALREGRKWGAFSHKYAIAAADYPGLEALLARAG